MAFMSSGLKMASILPSKTPPVFVYIAGHSGMVGSAIVRELIRQGKGDRLILATHERLDLIDTGQVNRFLCSNRPGQIYIAAAKVGGILANMAEPASFAYENLM